MKSHLPLPEKLGRYEILAELGQGMMGVVYKAMDPDLGRLLALKVVRLPIPIVDGEREELEQRFLHEANMAAGLSHPNIVVVHDVGRDPITDAPFMALEYLEGRTLAETLAQGGALDWRESLRLTALVADALHHAHQNGIVHRDVKPANIMVLPSGVPKILDFGIATVLATQLTAAGQCWGTPSYMSPEQALDAPLDGRSDLFSLGSVLYELLTGRRAFGGGNIPQIMMRVAHEDPEPPSRVKSSLPPDLDTVLLRALAKDPQRRYANGRALAEDLGDVLDGRAVRARPGLAMCVLASDSLDRTPRRRRGDIPYLLDPTVAVGVTPGRVRDRGRGRRRLLRAVPWGLSAALSLAIGIGMRPVDRGVAVAEDVATSSLLSVTGIAGSPTTPGPAVPAAAPPSAPTPPLATTPPRVEPARAAAAPPSPRVRKPVTPASPVVVATPSPVAVRAVATARVAISLQHRFKQGRLKVWVDDTLVLDKDLGISPTSKGVFRTRVRGNLADVFDVAPGERVFRLEVEGDDKRRGGQLTGVLRESETRLLEVKVDSSMQLKWKS